VSGLFLYLLLITDKMAAKKKAFQSDFSVIAGDKRYKVKTKGAVTKLLKDIATAHVMRGKYIVAIRKQSKTTWL